VPSGYTVAWAFRGYNPHVKKAAAGSRASW
jgi:hypothetical protein